MRKEIATLRKIAQSWGGDIFRVTQKTFDRLGGERPPRQRGPFYVGPFGDDEVVGIDWAGRRVYYVSVTWPTLIHEMAHAFAVTDPPDDSDDLEFLGWEWAMVAHIKADKEAWLKSMQYYGLDNGDYLGDLSRKQQLRLLDSKVRACIKKGMVSPKGVPLCAERKVDLHLLLDALSKESARFMRLTEDVMKKPVTTGKMLEERIHADAYSQGYKDAYSLVERLASSMMVDPMEI